MDIGFVFPTNQLHWWLGLAILVLALVVVGLTFMERRRQRRLEAFAEAALAVRLMPGYDGRVRRPLFWFVIFGFVFLALTLMQPRWGQAWQEVRQQSHDILVCLDTSESMRAANPLPSRLERAKLKILSILDRTPGDRFGLIAFSGAAAQQCPLTHDQGYYKAVLNAVDTDTVSEEGTDIAAAIREAVKVYKAESQTSGIVDKNSRAILIISDGEQVAGDAVAEAEKAAEYARVYVIGVGDPNGTEVLLPDWMGRYVHVQDGNKPHISKLDEETLTKIAMAGAGRYARSTPDTSDIEQLYEFIKEMSAQKVSSDLRFRLVNRYQWPLALAILCFAGEALWLALMPWLRTLRLRREQRAALAVSEEKSHA